MKLKILGNITLPAIEKSMTAVFNKLGYDPEKQYIRGATIYFNVYDRETGNKIVFTNGVKVVDSLEWASPEEKQIKELNGTKKKVVKCP